MVALICGHSPVQRVKTKEAIQTLPSRFSLVTVWWLRSVRVKLPTGPRSSACWGRHETPVSRQNRPTRAWLTRRGREPLIRLLTWGTALLLLQCRRHRGGRILDILLPGDDP